MFKRTHENNKNDDDLPFVNNLDPSSPTYYAQMLGAYSGAWKCDVLFNLGETPSSPPIHFTHITPTDFIATEDAEESDGEGIKFFDENEADPVQRKPLNAPVISNTEPVGKYEIINNNKLENETFNPDPKKTSPDPDPGVETTLLVSNNQLFSFFVPNLTSENHLCMEGMNFLIWDATCHIMGELAGAEDHGLFDKMTVSSLAKQAFELACVELGLVENELTGEEKSLIAGVAIWNLLLPRSAGGIYPNEEYAPFMINLNEKLSKFWEESKHQINRVVLKCAFSDFKEFAIAHFKIETEKNQSAAKKISKS